MTFLRILRNALFIGMAVFLVWHLFLIILHGEFYVTEKNPVILWGEFVGMIGVLALGIYFFRRELL